MQTPRSQTKTGRRCLREIRFKEECTLHVRTRPSHHTARAAAARIAAAGSSEVGGAARSARGADNYLRSSESVVGTRHGHYKQGTRTPGEPRGWEAWRTCPGNRINLRGRGRFLSVSALPATRSASSFSRHAARSARRRHGARRPAETGFGSSHRSLGPFCI